MYTLVFFELDVEIAGSLWVFPLLNFEPVVGNFAGEAFKKGGVGSQQIQCAVVVALTFKD
jgi:hypothetical protein